MLETGKYAFTSLVFPTLIVHLCFFPPFIWNSSLQRGCTCHVLQLCDDCCHDWILASKWSTIHTYMTCLMCVFLYYYIHNFYHVFEGIHFLCIWWGSVQYKTWNEHDIHMITPTHAVSINTGHTSDMLFALMYAQFSLFEPIVRRIKVLELQCIVCVFGEWRMAICNHQAGNPFLLVTWCPVCWSKA